MSELVEVRGIDCLVSVSTEIPFHLFYFLVSEQGLIQLFQKEFHHSKSEPLGTRWLNHEKRRSTDFDLAAKLCPEWTTDCLERRLNGD